MRGWKLGLGGAKHTPNTIHTWWDLNFGPDKDAVGPLHKWWCGVRGQYSLIGVMGIFLYQKNTGQKLYVKEGIDGVDNKFR